MPVEGEALQRLVRVSSAVATKVKLNLESFSDLKCLRQQKMVRLYNELKKSVEVYFLVVQSEFLDNLFKIWFLTKT